MKTLSNIPLDVKQLVLTYVDASSFVSLCCTSSEWNLLLRSLSQPSLTWANKVHQHVNARACEIWEDMLLLLPMLRARVHVHRWGSLWFERDVALYKNGRTWMRLQEQRHVEIKTIVLLESVWNRPAYTLATHKERMATVSSFSARAFDASRARVAELDVAIAKTTIGWSWERTETGIALANINKFQTTKAYLEWFQTNASQSSLVYDHAIIESRTSKVSEMQITFLELKHEFLLKVVEVCERELFVLLNNN